MYRRFVLDERRKIYYNMYRNKHSHKRGFEKKEVFVLKTNQFVTVIVAAAGGGTRMGGVCKPLIKIDGREALLYSLDLFCSFDRVKTVVISVRKEDEELFRALVEKENYPKEIIFAHGGDTRQQSVLNAFKAAFSGRKQTKFVAVHDAARPLLTKEYFENALDIASKYGNAVCACRARDTFKRSDKKDLICESVDRENLWQIQTPQIFDTDMFHTSLALAQKNGTDATDESSLVKDAGFLVKLCECGADNLKLTYPEDAAIAQAIMQLRREKEEKA